MKKKILLTVFAVILVLATALTCTACNKKELKLKNDMSADELMVALVKADVKSITKVETFPTEWSARPISPKAAQQK